MFKRIYFTEEVMVHGEPYYRDSEYRLWKVPEKPKFAYLYLVEHDEENNVTFMQCGYANYGFIRESFQVKEGIRYEVIKSEDREIFLKHGGTILMPMGFDAYHWQPKKGDEVVVVEGLLFRVK